MAVRLDVARPRVQGPRDAHLGLENLAGSADQEMLEMAAEILRAGLTGLAIWWHEHPHVPREQIVRTAVNVLWTGFDRARRPEAR